MKKNKSAGLLLIGVGTHFSSTVIASFVIGFGLDYLFDTTPIFMILIGMLGFVGGLIRAYEMLTRY